MSLLRAGRLAAVVGAVVVVALSACASPGGAGDGGGLEPPETDHQAVEQWATEVANAWSPTGDAWQRGYVPLQQPTAVDGTLVEEEKRALAAGWWESTATLPTTRPAAGTVLFRDGTLKLPLLSAAEAYQKMDQGDPPPCTEPSVPPVPDPSGGPDSSVSSAAGGDCVGLTTSAASLTTMELRTSRGVATVPAWRFEISGNRAVLLAAVADPAPVPSPAATPANRAVPPDMVSTQGVTSVEGFTLRYRLGVGACDRDITPIVVERPTVVVVAGAVTHDSGACTDQLLIEPVSVTLTEPLGDRPVLDGLNGTVLPVGVS
ncbi:hypothetical protein DFJ67_0894 [Asanoa ferruginea]|uniref:LppP/LprE lipoprotein n=1 Tax=Asanoa ferruginea TaxID=53367 RepID=A0A3D9ZDG3_9ACTN|nr:hypothetical protein [Asanoa ferruginea]REF94949.1 hypothetical protein DFJ67_0894 [Asanoa ferruginea]GIF45471.1 hypothetical protein Afe04nite_00100 [Asanoa ferruginea]